MLRPRDLVERFRTIHDELMQGMPFVHPDLEVEAVGFAPWENHELGVLITPWFMNLVLLPCGVHYDGLQQGKEVEFRFPSGPCDFAVNKDEKLGTYLSAVLFRTVINFPSQAFAREVAGDEEETAEQRGIVVDHVVDGRDRLVGHDQDVRRRRGVDVAKGGHVIVLVDDVTGDLSADDLLEQRGHGCSS